MFIILTAIFFLFLWTVFTVSFIKDRSRYRNCFFLFFALGFTFLILAIFANETAPGLLLAVILLFVIMLLIVPVFLIINGVLMLKREGRSLANLLSLVFGAVIGFGELATYLAVVMPEMAGNYWEVGGALQKLSTFSIFISVSVIYISVVFVVFMLYCIFLQIIPRKKDFDYIIIHGSGLLGGGRVSKLLADRIDKAIDIYLKDPTPTIMIPSGGRGSDETISEAEAMEGYLIDKGIPEDRIIKEDMSATTYENLLNSKAIIDSRPGRKYTVLVTSNYHVYRALRYCRKVGLKCTGVGSHVAFYYWPSALIREFIAVHAETKHFIYLVAGWILCLLPVVLLYFAH